MNTLDETHDPSRRSWVETANAGTSDFPIQNLPFGVFTRNGASPRSGVAIGDFILDLKEALQLGHLKGTAAEAAAEAPLNRLMAMDRAAVTGLRRQLSDLLRQGSPSSKDKDRLLVPMTDVKMAVPSTVANFTDFMVSAHHSGRLGAVRNPQDPLPQAFKYLPVAYHSRASTVRVSGESMRRPNGQSRGDDGIVTFGPSAALDFELELAIWIAGNNEIGTPVPMNTAPDRLFGYGLLNDWSARDMQRWEMPPLGPFLAKSLSTSVSPWIITADAMRPFAVPAHPRGGNDPALLPYLDSQENRERGGLSLAMEVWLSTPKMRQASMAPQRITATNFLHMYWTPAQMVTHHASNGCSLLPGDLLGSGTCSGPEDGSEACIAELLLRGPIRLPTGETRRFLEDGDEVTFKARASRDGAVSIGFGECRAVVEPALPWPVS